ncbi:tail assembly chaperone [Cytobacillus horneckiae]|uniref:tail assembly chaperone n=1 Tax=Cytobacillus horneckiae TaxID=549687 RepID=UPI003D9A21F2
MEIEINGKKYQLEFGMKFIRKMDEVYFIDKEGAKFGMGIESAVTYMAMQNPTVLFEIIKAGTSHLKSKPSNEEIETEIEKYAIEGKLEDLFLKFEQALGEAPFLKHKIKDFKEKARVQPE